MNPSANNTSTKLTWLFAIVLIIICPLILSYKTIDITLVPQFLFFTSGLLLSISLFFVFRIQKIYSLAFNPLIIALVCYFLFSCTSLIGAINKPEGIFDLLKIGSWLILIIVLVQLLKSNSETKNILFKAFSISSFVLAFIGLLQLTGIAFIKLPGQLIPYGTLGNRNIFVPSLLLTLPFVIYEIIISSKGKWKVFAVVSALLNIIVVVVSGMRTAWMAMAVTLFATGLLILLLNKKYTLEFVPKTIRLIKVFVFVFAFIGIAGIVFLYSHSTGNKTKTGSVLSMSSTNERTSLWKKSTRMFAHHPVNGVGEGNWRIMLPDYTLSDLPREAQAGEMHYQRPENDFIWILAETGITGLFSYIGIFVFGFFHLIKKLRNSKTNEEKCFSLLLLGALLLYSVIAFWGFPKERTFLSIELAVILSLIISDYQTEKSVSKEIIIHPVFFLIFLVFCIYKVNKLYAGEVQTQKLIDARAINQNELVIKYADKAIEQGYLMDPTSTPINFYKGVAYFNMNNIDSALSCFERARSVHPYHLHVLNNLATCFETKGNHEKTIECLNEALRISPDFQDARINLSAAYYNKGNVSKAKEIISKCRSDFKNEELMTLHKLISKKTNDSLIKLSAYYYNTGNIHKASETIEKCKNYNNNPKVKEIKNAIATYYNDSIIELANKYYKEGNIKASGETLLKCKHCYSNPEFRKIRKEVDKKIWEEKNRK